MPAVNNGVIGAAIAMMVGMVLCVPFAAWACGSILAGLELPVSRATQLVFAASPWWLGFAAVVLIAGLILKERVMGVRAALAANVATLIVIVAAAVFAMLFLLMPLAMVGDSMMGR